jgi:lambda family phage portal protein
MQPNRLDKIIAWLAPKSGERRARARIVTDALLAYEGARSARRQGGWNTTGSSGNAEIGAGLSKLRENSRDLCRNNAFAHKAKREWAKRVVGTGITPRPNTGREAVDRQIISLWNAWTQQCCSDSRLNFYAMQRQIVGTAYESGEVLVRLWDRRPEDGLPVPFQCNAIEADFIDSDKTQTLDNGYIIQGVEFDPIGRLRGYWLYGNHPGEVIQNNFRNSLASKFIPAQYVLHHAELDRPGDVRAVSRLASVIAKLRDLDEYEDAELVRKKICACMTAIFTQPEGSDGPTIGTVTTDDQGRRNEQFNPGMTMYGPPGFDVKTFTPTDSGDYSNYKKTELREIAVGLGIPYIILDDNMEAVNYSSFRGGMLSFREEIEEYRWNWLIPQVLNPIYRKFIDKAYVMNLIPEPNYAVNWDPPPFDLLDRKAEAEADRLELQIGKKTWPQLIGEIGNDPKAQITEISKWKEQIEEAGITFASSTSDTGDKNDAESKKVEPAGSEKPADGSEGADAGE